MHVDPPTFSAAAPATVSASASSSAHVAVADAAPCKTTAHDDALAKFRARCKHSSDCISTHTNSEEDPIGDGSEVADLDGDGVPEIMWQWGPPPITTESHLYRGGACATYLGNLGANAIVTPLKTRHEGFADIRVGDTSNCEGAMCGCTPSTDEYALHDGKYVADPKKHVDGTITPCPNAPLK